MIYFRRPARIYTYLALHYYRATPNGGATALIQAASNGHKDICSILLDAKADIATKNNKHRTPAAVARANKKEEMAVYLNNWRPSQVVFANKKAVPTNGGASSGDGSSGRKGPSSYNKELHSKSTENTLSKFGGITNEYESHRPSRIGDELLTKFGGYYDRGPYPVPLSSPAVPLCCHLDLSTSLFSSSATCSSKSTTPMPATVAKKIVSPPRSADNPPPAKISGKTSYQSEDQRVSPVLWPPSDTRRDLPQRLHMPSAASASAQSFNCHPAINATPVQASSLSVSLKDLTVQDIAVILGNLNFPTLQTIRYDVSGRMTFFEDHLAEWQSAGLVIPIPHSDVSLKPSKSPGSVSLVVDTVDVIMSSGNSWILDDHLTTHVRRNTTYFCMMVAISGIVFLIVFGDQTKEVKVKVKIVSMEKKRLLQREFEALNGFKDSKFFVKLLHDKLLSSAEFTVSLAAARSQALQFDNHIAMVMEKGVINVDQYLLEHRVDLHMSDYLNIIDSAFTIVKEAHQKKLVLLDMKGSNMILLYSGPGRHIWKGIDLDGALLEGTSLGSSFMATISFMAPELITSELSALHAAPSMDVRSLRILTFNVLVAGQRQTFWTLMQLYNDTDIKKEILSSRITQMRVDEHINRHFPGRSRKHLLLRMLKINPTERYTIAALENGAYLSGFATFRKTLEAVLEDYSSSDLKDSSACQESLRSLLESQLQSAPDLKAVKDSLTEWKSPVDTDKSSAFMCHVTTQLQQILSEANQQKFDAAKNKELLLKALRSEVKRLHDSFVQFGENVHKELAQNSHEHALLVLKRLSSIDSTMTAINQEQEAIREDVEKTLQQLQRIKSKKIFSDIETKIDKNTAKLMFICGHTMQLVSYGPKGDGYTVTDLKSF
eukprot:gene21451-27784_t